MQLTTLSVDSMIPYKLELLGLWSPISGRWSLVAGLRSSVSGLRSPVSGLEESLVSGLCSLVAGLWTVVPGHSHYRCMWREVTPNGCVRSSLFLVRAKIQQLQKLKLLPLASVALATHRHIERKLSDMKIVKIKMKCAHVCLFLFLLLFSVTIFCFSVFFFLLVFELEFVPCRQTTLNMPMHFFQRERRRWSAFSGTHSLHPGFSDSHLCLFNLSPAELICPSNKQTSLHTKKEKKTKKK
ncbi:LOW QUALITY PROTEIN: uncharacterized protein LOC122320909 [Drosophila ficusphila]|uniref:LOW QUALITY PROTEIN: uncharacterized protein LOC122320909 n=1 Tax=Drosophila ficusphila TaxID=30025 RepID=UPI001C8AB273|nr:LOW QUALITY PROTEIN: uncharacterized protein LOC122320909 [Drosophila ficusphila]